MGRRGCCCTGSCTATIHVRDGCSPFAAIVGASVGVYTAATGGTLIDSGTTNGSGDVSVSLPGGTGSYWVGASGSGCATGARKQITLTCGASTNFSLWCATGKHTLTVNKCCSGGTYPGDLTVTKGGVTVATGSSPLVFPKSEGTGDYVISIPASKGCNAVTNFTLLTVTSGNICTNTSSTITLSLKSGYTCCNSSPVPNAIKIIDSLGVHTSTSWTKTATGSRSKVNQTFEITDAEWRPWTSVPPPCIAPGCTAAWTLYGTSDLSPNTASVDVRYTLECITGGLRLTALWYYRSNNIGYLGPYDTCRLCSGVCSGACAGGTAPACVSGWPVGAGVNVSYTGGLCLFDFPASEYWRLNTYAPSGTTVGYTSTSATADWLGTPDPDADSITFSFTDPGWLFEGPHGTSSTPTAILPPPPPGGLSVTVYWP